jgi:hypothetical protein
VHRSRGGGARDSSHGQFPCSPNKNGNGTTLPAMVTRWCTILAEAVNTERADATPLSASSQLGQDGHRPRCGNTIGQGGGANPAPPSRSGSAGHYHRGGGALDRACRCPQGSTLSLVLPPFLYLFHHLCKCANTPCVSPSRASVLAFSQSFFKG